MMSKYISRRSFLQISGVVTAATVMAACAPAAAPQAGGETGSSAPASDTVNLTWDTFRAPGTGWNESGLRHSRKQTRMSLLNSAH